MGGDYPRDNLCNRMGRIVFGILTAVLVVVLYQILKDIGIEIVFLLKYGIKALGVEFVDDSPTEIVLPFYFGDQIRQGIKQAHAILRTGCYREYILVGFGDMQQGIVKYRMKALLPFAGKQATDKVSRRNTGNAWV